MVIRISPLVIIVFGQSIFDYHLILPEKSDPTLTPTQAFRIRCAQKHLIFRLRKCAHFCRFSLFSELSKVLCQLITRRSLGVDKTTDAIQQSVHKYCVRVATNSSLSRRFNHKSAETRTGQGFCNVPPVRVFCFGLPNECFDGLICSFQKKRRTARTSDPPLWSASYTVCVCSQYNNK